MLDYSSGGLANIESGSYRSAIAIVINSKNIDRAHDFYRRAACEKAFADTESP
jgi:hypothetical protein